jgi:four helix bundle protein
MEKSEPSKAAQNFKDLIVWQKAMVLAKLTYELTRGFPSEEKFGLVSQMCRAAVSIPPNIAEGQARHGTCEFIQFISHAEGSLAELETQFRLSVDLSFLDASVTLAGVYIDGGASQNAQRPAPSSRHSSLTPCH